MKKDLCHPIGVYDIISRGISLKHKSPCYDFLLSFSIRSDAKSFNLNLELENQELNETLFTTKINTDISLKQNRPALVVSSTSWWGHIIILCSLSLLWHHPSVTLNTRTWIFQDPWWKFWYPTGSCSDVWSACGCKIQRKWNSWNFRRPTPLSQFVVHHYR